MSPTDGQFSEATMRSALAAVTTQLGVTDSDARLLHLANNAVFALPGPGIVVRIARRRQLHERIRQGVRLGEWFESVDAPAIRLAKQIAQPLEADQMLATVWQYVPVTAPTPSVDDLGQVLREWHALPAPSGVSAWDPVSAARLRIDDAPGLSEQDRDYLLAWCSNLEPQIDELNRRFPGTLIHGDAHVGNLLRRPDGRILFCDFDSTSIGPPQVDLAAVAAAEIWFNQQGSHDALASSYGLDVTKDEDWPIFRSARELAFVVGGVPLLQSAPGIAEEFALRLQSVKTRSRTRNWTPYAQFG